MLRFAPQLSTRSRSSLSKEKMQLKSEHTVAGGTRVRACAGRGMAQSLLGSTSGAGLYSLNIHCVEGGQGYCGDSSRYQAAQRADGWDSLQRITWGEARQVGLHTSFPALVCTYMYKGKKESERAREKRERERKTEKEWKRENERARVRDN